MLRTLTETNLAIPREQFFRPDHSCMEPGSPDLDEAIRAFVTEERVADEYKNNRAEFIDTTTEMTISTLQYLCTLSSQGEGYATVVDSMKHAMGNVQILTGLREAFKITWPASMVTFANGLKIFLGQVWTFVDLQCALGSYTYYDKFTFMVLVPIFIVILVFVIAAALVATGLYADTESRKQLLSRVTTAVSFLVFLVYPMVSQCIFQGLICNQMAENEWWLAADLQVNLPSAHCRSTNVQTCPEKILRPCRHAFRSRARRKGCRPCTGAARSPRCSFRSAFPSPCSACSIASASSCRQRRAMRAGSSRSS